MDVLYLNSMINYGTQKMIISGDSLSVYYNVNKLLLINIVIYLTIHSNVV